MCLLIVFDNFPIFLEKVFNLLSFNKNLLLILSFDSNSNKLIILYFLIEFKILSNFKFRFWVTKISILLFLRFSFNSSLN